MNEFKDKVAVITGAASGIGKALAKRCIAEEMKVVLCDIEKEALIQTENEIKNNRGNILSVVGDVSRLEDIETFAQKTIDNFGAVHLLFNNAGVGAGSTVWDTSINDWKWALGVNLWGVIFGTHVFVPIMLKQETECHIINTASIAGLLPFHGSAPYQVTKHAVVALSEKLYYDLGANSGRVKVSVLCPGWVKTRILESERNRPQEYKNEEAELVLTPEIEAMIQQFQQAVETGMAPDELADKTFEAIKDNQFYIITHPEYLPIAKARMEAIIQVRNPKSLEELYALTNM